MTPFLISCYLLMRYHLLIMLIYFLGSGKFSLTGRTSETMIFEYIVWYQQIIRWHLLKTIIKNEGSLTYSVVFLFSIYFVCTMMYWVGQKVHAVFCPKWGSKYVTYEFLLNDVYTLLFDYLSPMIGQIKDPLPPKRLRFFCETPLKNFDGFGEFFPSREFRRKRKRW